MNSDMNTLHGKSVICRYCQDQMERMSVKTFSEKWALGMMIMGLICCLFVIGPLIGIPIFLFGIYMWMAENTINYCPSCGHYYKILHGINT